MIVKLSHVAVKSGFGVVLNVREPGNVDGPGIASEIVIWY
jgi:hypothetical protein